MPSSILGFQPLTFPPLRPISQHRLHVTCPRRPVASLSPNDVILEGDLIAYRPPNVPMWNIAAVVSLPESDKYLVRPVVQRQYAPGDDVIELFIDWTPGTTEAAIAAASCDVRLLDTDFEQRVVQDRLENPHGEVSEYCWRVRRAALGADTLPILVVE